MIGGHAVAFLCDHHGYSEWGPFEVDLPLSKNGHPGSVAPVLLTVEPAASVAAALTLVC